MYYTPAFLTRCSDELPIRLSSLRPGPARGCPRSRLAAAARYLRPVSALVAVVARACRACRGAIRRRRVARACRLIAAYRSEVRRAWLLGGPLPCPLAERAALRPLYAVLRS